MCFQCGINMAYGRCILLRRVHPPPTWCSDSVLVLTELVLTTYWLLAEWGGRAEALKRTLGSLCACTATHLFGCFLCIRFATIITHRCQVGRGSPGVSPLGR